MAKRKRDKIERAFEHDEEDSMTDRNQHRGTQSYEDKLDRDARQNDRKRKGKTKKGRRENRDRSNRDNGHRHRSHQEELEEMFVRID